MTNIIKLAAIAMLGMGLGLTVTGPVYAQPASTVGNAIMTADNKERVSKLIGAPVFNDQGEQFGMIDDVLVAASGGEPTAILSVGGFLGVGNKLVAVPLSHVRLEGARMTMTHASKPELANMNAYGYYHMSNG